jgi:amino acid adenylation domain-containing protein
MIKNSIQPTTLIELLQQRTRNQPDKLAYTFLVDGETEKASLTYAQLEQQVRTIAAQLQEMGISSGERALLLYPQGLDYVVAFFGCIYAGVIAVPAYPPRQSRSDIRLQAIATDAQAKIVLTTKNILARMAERLTDAPALNKLPWLATDDFTESARLRLSQNWKKPDIVPDTLAFLQYTSGSTGTPKGAMVSHGNLLHNSAYTASIWQYNSESIMVTWLPIFHDMGLIFGILQPVYMGFPCYLMSPATFVQRPFRWLQAISHYKATHSGAPNFAYDLCVQKISTEQRASLDLSSWCMSLNAAEPVRAETFQQFNEVFKPCGLQPTTVCHGYGLAEATLIVAGAWKQDMPAYYKIQSDALEQHQVVIARESHQETQTLVGSGYPAVDAKVVIVNPTTLKQCSPDEVGEIWVSSPSVVHGYWQRPVETAETFQAYLSDTGAGPFLRTGDLGFLRDGELFVTGRIKDVIIIRGNNYYPQDIEFTVEKSHPMLRPAGYGAVFTVEKLGQEQLIVTQEVERTALKKLNVDEVVNAIRQAVSEEHDLQVHAILLLKPAAIPRTSSGKIQRSACRDEFLEDTLKTVARWQQDISIKESVANDNYRSVTVESIQTWLLTQLSERLKIAPSEIDIQKPLARYGLDSITAVSLSGELEIWLECSLSPTIVYDYSSIQAISQYLAGEVKCIDNQTSKGEQPLFSLPTITPYPDAHYQAFPLNDIQRAYWLGRSDLFTLGNVAPHYYIELDCPLFDIAQLNRAWQLLIERHEMLRAVVLANGQQQILERVPPYQISRLNLQDETPEEVAKQLAAIQQEMIDRVFNVQQWPLFEIRVTQWNEETIRLHFSIDLIITDGWSLSILGHEWWQLYQTPDHTLAPLTLSFRDYVIAEQAWYQGAWYQEALTYWLDRIEQLPSAPQLPMACQPESLEKPRFSARQFQISEAQWQTLKDKASHVDITPSMLLLTAFADILALWSKNPHFTLNLTLFNRLSVHEQVNQVIGDFTSLLLLEVNNSQQADFTERARCLQRQLWHDLKYRCVSGVRVMREIAGRNKAHQSTMMPIVFTSMLALEELGDNLFSELGEQVFEMGITPQVWLDYIVIEKRDGLQLLWNSVDDLFPEGLLDDMFAAYQNHIQQLINTESAWQSVTTQSLLPATHLDLQRAVNATEHPFPDQFIHTLFLEQVAIRAEQPAVVTTSCTLSYAELHLQAQQIGQWLRQQGAQPNTLVAVVMEKGWEQVIAIMGILLSGAAYLPIDPELPEKRREFLLQEGEVKLVLTQTKLAQQLIWPTGIQHLNVDAHDLPPGEALLPLSDQSTSDLAYVIYTSGSTGLPKGVMIDHRGAVNTLLDINRRFAVTAADRVLALSALHFDLSVYDIFGVLAAGGTVVIPEPERRRDPQHWADLMVNHGVTLWDTVPALMQMLVDYQNGAPLAAPLRLVMMSGDWIPLNLPDRIRQLWPDSQVISLGGATEASIWSIHYPIATVDPTWNSIPYGKPLTNQTYHVLNERLEPCPVWVPSQLYIGGIGLALGYWRDEEKTKASFFTHPHTGERLYKTGDLGRYLPDGNIEFLGREDFQVKIRGHRIELGEIESHLLKQPDIKETIVAAVGEGRHDKQLVAYIVSTESGNDTTTEAQPVDQATYGLQVMQGVLTDPIERLQFKLNQPGIRQFETARPEVALPEADIDETAYLARQSYRQFLDEPITLTQLGQLLSCLRPRSFPNGVLPKYWYGSAGSLYPVQSYLYIKPDRMTDLAGGFYYYHPINHKLVLLSSAATINQELHGGTNQIIFDQSAFSLFLVAEYQAIEPMYGSSARDFCLLEAGYMSQLLMMEVPEYDLGLCPIGGMDFEPLRTEFGLSDSQEMVHSFLGGGISAKQKEQLAQTVPQDESLEERLKAYLSQNLPRYMVPNVYVQLPELPLTANGKINYKALPIPDLSTRQTAEFVQPSNELERRLVELVQKLFNVESISLTDDFFDLGANSLDMVQLYNEIKTAFQREITIADIFNHTTVQMLAEFLSQAPATAPSAPTNTVPTSDLNPEQIDRLSANLDNLTEAEVEQLLAKLEQE